MDTQELIFLSSVAILEYELSKRGFETARPSIVDLRYLHFLISCLTSLRYQAELRKFGL